MKQRKEAQRREVARKQAQEKARKAGNTSYSTNLTVHTALSLPVRAGQPLKIKAGSHRCYTSIWHIIFFF